MVGRRRADRGPRISNIARTKYRTVPADVTDQSIARLHASGPTSLFREETGDRIIQAAEPIPVRAWVRFGPEPVHVDAEAVAWTPTAVRIRFEYRTGRWDAWVWASAVQSV